MTKGLEMIKLKNIAAKRKLSIESEEFCDSQVENQLYRGKDVIYIDRQDGDTLQKMAVTFNCSIAEIKFLNKIYNDQEFHAIRTVKIPVVKGGALYHKYNEEDIISVESSEKNEDDTLSLTSSEDLREFSNDDESKYKLSLQIPYEIKAHISEDEHDICDCGKEQHLLHDKTIFLNRIHSGSATNVFETAMETTLPEFMNEMDEKIRKDIEKVESKNENLKEVVNMLKEQEEQVVFAVDRKTKPEISGSICSLTWGHFIFIICLVAVVVPSIYLIHLLLAK